MIAKVATFLSLAAMAAAGAIAPHGGFSTSHRKQDMYMKGREFNMKYAGTKAGKLQYRIDISDVKLKDFGRYSFGYNVVNGLGARNSRYETGAAYGPVVGSYSLADIDGRARRVDYVADKLGFRAVVRTNEPGTKTSLAAAAPYVSAKGPVVPSAGFGGGYFPFAGGYGGYGGYGGFYG